MFDNIGSKIKTLAKILCVVEFILCLLAAFFLFQLSSKFGSAGGSLRLYGFVVLIFGPLIFWVGNFILYGFGELVDNSAIIAHRNGKIQVKLSLKTTLCKASYIPCDFNVSVRYGDYLDKCVNNCLLIFKRRFFPFLNMVCYDIQSAVVGLISEG